MPRRLDVLAVLAEILRHTARIPKPSSRRSSRLQPRLYSISSSPKMRCPAELSLTVDAVRYEINKRNRLGVASTFLADRIEPGDELQRLCAEGAGLRAAGRSEHADHHDRARHRHRAVPRLPAGAPRDQRAGPNWLFFGHQRSDYDFFYEDELKAMRKSGHLTRLTLAWSRDGDEKFYVQDRMRDDGRDLWAWLERGAHIYVCGDAKRMAKDVERALIDVMAEHGKAQPRRCRALCRRTEKE